MSCYGGMVYNNGGLVNKGPLYLNNGYGQLDPSVIQWNHLADGCYTNLTFTTKTSVGSNINYVKDLSGNGRHLDCTSFTCPLRVTSTGVLGISAVSTENSQCQTTGSNLGTNRTVIAVSNGSTQPLFINSGNHTTCLNASAEGWTVGSQPPQLYSQYPAHNNPNWSTGSDSAMVVMVITAPNPGFHEPMSLYINKSLLMPMQFPDFSYGTGTFLWNGSSGGAGNHGVPRELWEVCILNRTITANEIITFSNWFGKRAKIAGY